MKQPQIILYPNIMLVSPHNPAPTVNITLAPTFGTFKGEMKKETKTKQNTTLQNKTFRFLEYSLSFKLMHPHELREMYINQSVDVSTHFIVSSTRNQRKCIQMVLHFVLMWKMDHGRDPIKTFKTCFLWMFLDNN